MRINNNISAMNANRNLGKVNNRLSKTMQRLSSGLRIATAADDAAGLAISEQLRGNIKGAQASSRASQETVSKNQIADAALEEVSSLLTRGQELIVQRAGTSDTTAQTAIDAEITSITSQMSSIMTGATYNGSATISGVNVRLTANATGSAVNGFADGTTALQNVQTSISNVATARGGYGNAISAAESNSRAQDALAENLQAAESRVRDADMATEMVSFTKDSIIQQAAQAMLAQANQLPQSIIGLLQ
jgi:flagellin